MSTTSRMPAFTWAAFKSLLQQRIHEWRDSGLPGRWRIVQDLQDLERLRRTIPVEAMPPPEAFPLVYLATVDDGWGHGLDVIEAAARAVGARTVRLGLMRSASEILEKCARQAPHILGVTVLHAESESVIASIAQGLPHGVKFVAGGPVFHWDSDFAQRTGIHEVLEDVSVFLQRISELLP